MLRNRNEVDPRLLSCQVATTGLVLPTLQILTYPKLALKKVDDQGGCMMIFQEIIDSIESLPIEDQDYLLELIRKRRIESRRAEILVNAQEVQQSFREGTAKRGSVDNLIADLLGDDDGSCLE